jgi:membrane protein
MYGALATLPLFILWVYVSWWVALFGAEVAATLGEMRGGISTEAVRPARTRKPEE